MKKNIAYGILCIFILFLVEQVIELPYIIKTLIKLPLFTVYPLIRLKGIKFKVEKDLKLVIGASVFVFSVILLAFIILRGFLDFEAITSDIQGRMAIDRTLFIFACLYTVFINSFIEELFFRGLLFQAGDYKYSLVSALMFATYHVAIFKSWFSLPIVILVLFGLVVGGLIFNYFVKRTQSILSSWLIHMSADLIIVLIGFWIFA